MASSSKEPTFHIRIFAIGHAGFPPILSDMLTQALGSSVSPEYLVFQSEPVPHLCRYQAKVHICPSPTEDGKPLTCQGKPMPTPALAVQTAAAEAIGRLRFQFPQVAEMREFRYFPSVSSLGFEYPSTVEDADPAIARLVQFITTQGLLIGGILGEFKAMDKDTTRVVTEAYRETRQAATQTVNPMLPNPVPPSQLVNPYRPGIINTHSINRVVRRFRRQGLLRQVPFVTHAVEPRPMEIPDFGKCLSLRPPGEPRQD